MQRLRDPDNGCPWDVAQTFKSIVPSTLEECYELVEAIESEDYPHVAEELGDVLFQVVFYTQLGDEQDLFSFRDVVHTLVEKLLRRHPHVFANGKIEGIVNQRMKKGSKTAIEDVKESWEAIKQKERDGRVQPGIFDDVPLALPALPRAQKIQKRAAKLNFDWPDKSGALDKIKEEFAELVDAIEHKSSEAVEEEMGDLLFSCVNAARHLDVDAEASLRRASSKFELRIGEMNKMAAAKGENLAELDEDQLDSLWRRAKSTLG